MNPRTASPNADRRAATPDDVLAEQRLHDQVRSAFWWSGLAWVIFGSPALVGGIMEIVLSRDLTRALIAFTAAPLLVVPGVLMMTSVPMSRPTSSQRSWLWGVFIYDVALVILLGIGLIPLFVFILLSIKTWRAIRALSAASATRATAATAKKAPFPRPSPKATDASRRSTQRASAGRRTSAGAPDATRAAPGGQPGGAHASEGDGMLLVATYHPQGLDRMGFEVRFGGGCLVLENYGRLRPADLVSFDRAGKVVWVSDETRRWVSMMPSL